MVSGTIHTPKAKDKTDGYKPITNQYAHISSIMGVMSPRTWPLFYTLVLSLRTHVLKFQQKRPPLLPRPPSSPPPPPQTECSYVSILFSPLALELLCTEFLSTLDGLLTTGPETKRMVSGSHVCPCSHSYNALLCPTGSAPLRPCSPCLVTAAGGCSHGDGTCRIGESTVVLPTIILAVEITKGYSTVPSAFSVPELSFFDLVLGVRTQSEIFTCLDFLLSPLGVCARTSTSDVPLSLVSWASSAASRSRSRRAALARSSLRSWRAICRTCSWRCIALEWSPFMARYMSKSCCGRQESRLSPS